MPEHIQVAVVGGGSYGWVPTLTRDVILSPGLEDVSFRLLDVNRTAAEETAAVGRRMAKEWGLGATFKPMTSAARALDGADFVVITISTGGLDAMQHEGLHATRLVVVGDSPRLAETATRVRRMGLSERVRFVGSLHHRDVVRSLPAFDIMVLPGTSSFSSPLKLHEWMAAGLAIVAADQPNLREILEHDRNCLLAEAGDSGALAAAISTLAADPGRRVRLGERARKDVIALGLTWRNNAEAIVNAVTGLVATSTVRGAKLST